MKQEEIKTIFLKSIENGHIITNNSSDNFFNFKCNESSILDISHECYFGKFDFVFAIIEKITTDLEYEMYSDINNTHRNLLMRSNQFMEISQNEKCKIDHITFYPFEIKSNHDILDKRLTNQVLNAILTFGRSFIILDTKHIQNKNSKYLRLLPATIIGYTGKEDYFEIISIFDRIVFDGILNLPKRRLIKQLLDNKIVNFPKEANHLLKKLKMIEKINQKIIFNYFYKKNITFSNEEKYFLQQLLTINNSNSHISDTKQLSDIITKSVNHSITDFI